MAFKTQAFKALKTMRYKKYWNRPNTVEFFAFMTKIAIIFPGLLLGKQFWWLYVFALISSFALIWSSTVKTLPTITGEREQRIRDLLAYFIRRRML